MSGVSAATTAAAGGADVFIFGEHGFFFGTPVMDTVQRYIVDDYVGCPPGRCSDFNSVKFPELFEVQAPFFVRPKDVTNQNEISRRRKSAHHPARLYLFPARKS